MPDMKEILAFENRFEEVYTNPENVILSNSPELLFIRYICDGDFDSAVALFDEDQLFGNVKSCVDAPQGRFEGLSEIRSFCESWLSYAGADKSWVVPVIQTRAGGRSCTEMMVYYHLPDGNQYKFPMLVCGDLRGAGRLDEIRIYFFYQWLPNISPYRHRIFKPSHDEMCELNSMCGVMREYVDALHALDETPEAMERMMNTFNEDAYYGGYRPESISAVIQGRDVIQKKYVSFIHMTQYIRFEAITDNGRTAVCEWVGAYRPEYQPDPKKALLQSGVGIYDRDPKTGRLSSTRIIDNARFVDLIDWDQETIRY